MRVGVISDTHGLLREEAVRAMAGSDVIVHAGDVGRPEVLARLREIAPTFAVRGNVDRDAWARELPETLAQELGGVWVYVLHDLHTLDLSPQEAGFRVVISGHSHVPRLHEERGVLFLNPGSAGPRRFSLPISAAVLHVTGAGVRAELLNLAAATRPA